MRGCILAHATVTTYLVVCDVDFLNHCCRLWRFGLCLGGWIWKRTEKRVGKAMETMLERRRERKKKVSSRGRVQVVAYLGRPG